MNSFTETECAQLIAELHDICEDPETIQEYLAATEALDQQKLNFFADFGPSVRHQVINVKEFRRGLLFGFTDITLNECGWIDYYDAWPIREEVSLRHPHDKAITNYVTLVCGPNGQWTFGYSMNFGSGAGSSSPASVFGDAFDTREECLLAALSYIEATFSEKIKVKEATPDPSNYKVPYMKSVLLLIQKRKSAVQGVQLALF